MAGSRTFRVLTCSQQSGIESKKKKQYTHSTTNTHKITHTIQLQQYTRSTNNNYPKDNLKLGTQHPRKIRIQHVQKVKTAKQESPVNNIL